MRNNIRHRLLPLLEKHFNPNVKETLAHLAFSAAIDMEYIYQHTHALLKRVIRSHTTHRFVLSRKTFCRYHPAVCFRIIEEALQRVSPQASIDFLHWRLLWKQVHHSGRFRMNISGGVEISVQYHDIVIQRMNNTPPDFHFLLNVNESVILPSVRMRLRCTALSKSKICIGRRRSVEYFDRDRLHFPLHIRTRRKGDRFMPLGMRGQKKLKDFFIEHKISQYKRDSIPLVVSGTDIIWVVPYGIADAYKITPSTKNAVRISVTSLPAV